MNHYKSTRMQQQSRMWLQHVHQGWNQILTQLQRLGKSLMFPIAVLPIAALLLRIGTLIADPAANQSLGINHVQVIIGTIIKTPGSVIFDHLPIIFAIGVGFGLAKDLRGECALVAAVIYLGIITLLKEGLLASQIYGQTLTVVGTDHKKYSQLLYFLNNNHYTYKLDLGVIGGIISGVISACLYNRYHQVKLPASLAFFGGRRFVPMLGVLSIVPLALFFALLWPWIQYALILIGTGLVQTNGYLRGFAAGVYAFLNRLLQPFGLHHIINTFLWFQLPETGRSIFDNKVIEVNGDITAFNKGLIGSGIFTTGFFPLFLGGLPGAALALIMTSDRDQRKKMLAFYGSVAFVAFLTGIDEPLVFSFIFISPLLYVSNALLTGLMYMFVSWTHISMGFGFSAGLIDYIVSFPMSWNLSTHLGVSANPLWLFAFSGLMFVIYFSYFYLIIKWRKVPTPGREHQLNLSTPVATVVFGAEENSHPVSSGQGKPTSKTSVKKDKYQLMAQQIGQIVGLDNIQLVENCATRLRLVVNDNDKQVINDQQIMTTGVRGVVRLGKQGYQIIIGTDVEHVADALKTLKDQQKR